MRYDFTVSWLDQIDGTMHERVFTGINRDRVIRQASAFAQALKNKGVVLPKLTDHQTHNTYFMTG